MGHTVCVFLSRACLSYNLQLKAALLLGRDRMMELKGGLPSGGPDKFAQGKKALFYFFYTLSYTLVVRPYTHNIITIIFYREKTLLLSTSPIEKKIKSVFVQYSTHIMYWWNKNSGWVFKHRTNNNKLLNINLKMYNTHKKANFVWWRWAEVSHEWRLQ